MTRREANLLALVVLAFAALNGYSTLHADRAGDRAERAAVRVEPYEERVSNLEKLAVIQQESIDNAHDGYESVSAAVDALTEAQTVTLDSLKRLAAVVREHIEEDAG